MISQTSEVNLAISVCLYSDIRKIVNQFLRYLHETRHGLLHHGTISKQNVQIGPLKIIAAIQTEIFASKLRYHRLRF